MRFRKKKVSIPKTRRIKPFHNGNSLGFCNNKIKTSKYNVFTFIFKNLWEQFHRFANIYFVFILVLNFMPGINAFAKEIAPIPVIIVLLLTAVKDAIEDLRRHISDKRINNKKTLKFTKNHGYIEDSWESLLPGDFVKIKTNEIIPADMIILRSSDPTGIVFVETMNLDGENNLKQRESLKFKNYIYSGPCSFEEFIVEVEGPNPEIYHFSGCVLHHDEKTVMKKENVLLRGCNLRNTDYIEGMIVYTGHETKAMLNNTGNVFKKTKLETLINKDILWCILILAIVCLTGAIGSGVWQQSFPTSNVLFLALNPESTNSSPAFQAFLNFWTFIIIFQSIIPLPLYVTLEFVKMHQVWHIQQDIYLYDEKTNKRIEVRSFKIPEDLGQIDYVFCDKTGTLTENKMVFKRASIYGVEYIVDEDSNSDNCSYIKDETIDLSNASSDSTQETDDVSLNDIRNLNAVKGYVSRMSFNHEGVMAKDSFSNIDYHSCFDRSSEEAYYVEYFFLILAVCNTTVISINKNKAIEKKKNMTSSKRSYLSGRLSSRNIFKSLPKIMRNSSSNNSINDPASTVKSETKDNKTNRDKFRQLSIVKEDDFYDEQVRTQSTLIEKAEEVNEVSYIGSPTKSVSLDDLNMDKTNNQILSRSPTYDKLYEEKYEEMTRDSSLTGSKTSFCADCPVDEELLPSMYESESPDEITLVKLACRFGCKLIQRTLKSVQLYMPDKSLGLVDILNILPFDSVRKRMSIVIRHPISKSIVLLTKGADSSIMSKLSQNESDNPIYLVRSTKNQIKKFSKVGLRTLVLAKRNLSQDYFKQWAESLKAAETSFEDEDREASIRKIYEEMENDFCLIGATAIEDKLQEDVPLTIERLRKASMKVWVLTGDKQETAISIAYSARLFHENQRLLKLNAKSKDEIDSLIKSRLDEIHCSRFPNLVLRSNSTNNNETNPQHYLKQVSQTQQERTNPHHVRYSSGQIFQAKMGITKNRSNFRRVKITHNRSESTISHCPEDFSLVIDGDTLSYIIDDEEASNYNERIKSFISLCKKCSSVVCCRATPLQKAKVVTLIKNKLHTQTLAIGDGANDVNMIQAANVGIGISGQEGMQAVMASDFAISQFKFLGRLLLVHGHWCYDKLARTALYLYYKNAIYIFTMFWFQIFNGFSGSTSFDQLSQVLFAVTMTGLTPFILGIWDKPLDDMTLMQNPSLYQDGPMNRTYRNWHFWVNIFDALWQSLIIFFLPYLAYMNSSIDIWSFGMVKMNALVTVTTIHMLLVSKNLTVIHFFVAFLSYFLFWLVFMVIYNSLSVTGISPESPYQVIQTNLRDPLFHLLLLLIIPTALLPRILFKSIRNSTNPSLTTLAQVLIKKYGRGKVLGSIADIYPRPRGQYDPYAYENHANLATDEENGPASIHNIPQVRIMTKVNRVLSLSEQLVLKKPSMEILHKR